MKSVTVILLAAMFLAGGCGKGDESAAKRVGKKVGGAAVDFGSGVGKGVDEKMAAKVELAAELTKQGIAVTASKGLGLEQKGVSIYLTTKTPLKGTLIAKALNKEGLEIGRSVTEVDYAADDGKHANFVFEKEVDTQMVDKYVVDLKK